MVELTKAATGAAAVAMQNTSWLLLGLLLVLFNLVHLAQAATENKLAEVSGEEGAIDQLEAYLLSHALQQQQQEKQEHQQQQGQQGQQQQEKQENKGLDNSNQKEQQTKQKSEKIEFGVHPSDPRYFISDDDQDLTAARANDFVRRSDTYFNPPNSLHLHNNVYNSPDLNNLALDYNSRQYEPPNDLQSYNQNLNRYDAYPGRATEDEDIVPYLRRLGYAADYTPTEDGGDAHNILYNILAQRLAEKYGSNADPNSAFFRRLEEVLRSGDEETARRMLGEPESYFHEGNPLSRGDPNSPLHGNNNHIGLDEPSIVRATSQPESVHFLHHKPVQREQKQSIPDVEPKQLEKEDVQEAHAAYNPNDPSSNINIEMKTDKNATRGALQLDAAPQHFSQSQHSAQLARANVSPPEDAENFSDVLFAAIVAGCTAAAVCAIIGTGVCWYRLNKNQRAAKDAEYPAYGVTGPSRDLSPGSGSGGDRNLAHSAHMYHYQQQKNQMIAIDKSGVGDGGQAGGGGGSDIDSEEDEGEDRDYTVYECPGLAPMGEMVVPNPMYPTDDTNPASPTLKEDPNQRN